MTNDVESIKAKNKRLLKICVGVGVGMFAFAFALVPIYNVLCNALYINGKTGGAVVYDQSSASIDKSRTITVEFTSTNNEQLPWTFRPLKAKVKVHPGEITRVAFFAHNNADKTMVIQAIPSVAPAVAARYLKKTECFCFTQQSLEAHKGADMPVLFHIDRDLPDYVKTITLSYTLFDVTNFKRKPNQTPGKLG